jgi:hypothetical protein
MNKRKEQGINGDNKFLFSLGYNQIDQVRIWIGFAFNNQFLCKCI